MIEEACSKGHLDFGENNVQELVHKYESLPKYPLAHDWSPSKIRLNT